MRKSSPPGGGRMGGRASPTTRGGGSGRAPRGQGTFADPDRSRDGTIPARAHLRSVAGKKGAITKENVWCLCIISGVMFLLALGAGSRQTTPTTTHDPYKMKGFGGGGVTRSL